MNLSFSTKFTAPQETEADALLAQLVKVDTAGSAALNEWLLRRPAPVFQMHGAEYELQWAACVDRQWHVMVELACGAHRAILALDGLAAMDPLLVGEPFKLLPTPLRDLAIHRLLALVLSSAPPSITQALEVRAVSWETTKLVDWPCQLSFSLTRRPEGTRMLGTMLFETAAALQWLHLSLPIDATSERSRLTLALPLRLIVGRSMVTADALAGLGEGDVVWIETAAITREGIGVDLLAPLAQRRWRCRAHRAGLRVLGADQDVEAHAGEAPGGANRITERGERFMSAERSLLEAPVTFDLGEINMKVQELERLQPGHVIDLPQDVAGATVSLRVAGRRIAEGTLVAVGRRLGVRISRNCIGQQAG